MTRTVTTRLFVLSFLLLGVLAQDEYYGKMNPDYYCTGRTDTEFFRRELPDEAHEDDYRYVCNIFYRCIPAAGGTQTLSRGKCQSGMMFDVEQQNCKLSRDVFNCNTTEKYKPPLPKWPLRQGEKSKCEEGQIECGSGECLARNLFCDEIPDCADGSDENACGPQQDPNAAERCDNSKCAGRGGCFCSVDGTRIPDDIPLEEVPQMIMITFSGAVGKASFDVYNELFSSNVRNNRDGCTIKGTFFVAHPYTNYSAVQELDRRGHDIALNSVTNNKNASYWSNLSEDEYVAEYVGGRTIIERFSNISDVFGMRVPMGRVGGNAQFNMMQYNDLIYDSSIAAPRQSKPLWPYELTFRMPHKCLGTDQRCPSRNFTIWEMVLNEFDRREDLTLDEQLTGCHYIDSCNINDAKYFRKILDQNLMHHYRTNRAPFGVHFTASYFLTRKNHLKEFKDWIQEKTKSQDMYFVSMFQALNWIVNPTPLSRMNEFSEWGHKCELEGVPACSLPNPCSKRVPRLFPKEDKMFLYTCEECPNTYPWLYDPYGEGSLNDL